jgi:AcrR family transcriptional regulator
MRGSRERVLICEHTLHECARTQTAAGHLRVAAILEAGVAVFTEKGYEAATMTEIAARSGTAIGSLYRFFPSKEVLADALLQRYAQHVTDRFAALGKSASTLSVDALADALVDFTMSLQSQRSFAAALLDARGGSDERRVKFRQSMREGLAGILRRVIPVISKAKAEITAVVLLHVLKGFAVVADEKPGGRRLLQAEIRRLVHVYLDSDERDASA